MLEVRVISIGTLNVEPASGYDAGLQQLFVQPEATIHRVELDEDTYETTKVSVGPHVYSLPITVNTLTDETEDFYNAKYRALIRALDTRKGPVTVTIENVGGTPRRRYMNFVVRRADPLITQTGIGFTAQLVATDKMYWRSVTQEVVTLTFDQNGNHTVNVMGDLDVPAIIELEPQTEKVDNIWLYRRRFILNWRSPFSGWHTLDVTGGGLNTATLVSDGKVTDGSNIGVMFNGSFTPIYYGKAFGTSTTTIWINADLRSVVSVPLLVSIGQNDTGLRILNGLQLPPSGALQIGSEVITYTGRTQSILYGVTRGAFDTTKASHTAGDLLTEVYVGFILYGPNGKAPYLPGQIASQEPVLDLVNSTNSAWLYTSARGFNDGDYRTGGWRYGEWLSESGRIGYVNPSAESGTFNDSWTLPWRAMGLRPGKVSFVRFNNRFALPIASTRIKGRHMIGASPATWTGAAVWNISDDALTRYETLWDARTGATQPPPNRQFDVTTEVPASWGASGNRLQLSVNRNNHIQVDITEAQVTFDSDYTPIIQLGPEQTDYDMNMQIENLTTGEGLSVSVPDMEPHETLIIDSERRTVTYTKDNSNRYGAVERDGPRPYFMTLTPGNNTLAFTEDGMGQMQVRVRYTPRWYA
jgi:hypothetical protein